MIISGGLKEAGAHPAGAPDRSFVVLVEKGASVKRALDWVMFLNRKVLVGLLVVFTFVIVLQVIFRYVLNAPLTWTEQVARYLFVWMVMLGTPLALRMNVHIAFDTVLRMFPARVRAIISTVNVMLIAAFAAYWFRHSLNLVLRSTRTIAAGIDIPINYVYSAQPVAAVLVFAVCLEALLSRTPRRDADSAGAAQSEAAPS